MLKKIVLIVFFGVIFVNVYPSYSQCAMCKSTVESNAKMEITNRAQGLNHGILYLMSIPYVIFGVLAFLWYRHSKKAKAERDKIDVILSKIV